MKTTILQIIGAVCLGLGISDPVISQGSEKLRIELAASFGQEFFKIKAEDFVTGKVREETKSSTMALGGGIWLEKFVSRRFSLMPQIDYHFIKVNDNVNEGNISAIPGPIRETYHSLALGLSGRYYLPFADGFRLSVDAGVKADKMLYFRFQHAHIISTRAMPDYYGFANPGLTAGFGTNKGRWALSVHYQCYFTRSESKLINPETGVQMAIRTISRQNTLIRLTYSIWQAKTEQ
jgi:hypothetical protein